MEPIILPRISDQKPLVSVVSITYNHEPYIRDCLEGFLMQKTNFPVEVIIHDDASTDHTADIIREYYEKRPDLFHVIIERENQYSQHKSVSLPLYQQAKGKYIALCEGDDYWTDSLKLQKQFDFMESHPDYSCCFHNVMIKNTRNNSEKKYYKKRIKREWDLRDIIIAGGGLMPTASMFFRKKNTHDYKMIKEGCPVGDYPLSICLARNGRIHYTDDIMSTYRVLAKGSWSERMGNDPTKYIDSLESMIKWMNLLKNKIIDKTKEIDLKIAFINFEICTIKKDYRHMDKKEMKSIYMNQTWIGKICMSIFVVYINHSLFYIKIVDRIIKKIFYQNINMKYFYIDKISSTKE